jgi:hypothetical protein
MVKIGAVKFWSLRTDNSGVAPLKKEGQLVADTKQKANILNQQFQSVFTSKSMSKILLEMNLAKYLT